MPRLAIAIAAFIAMSLSLGSIFFLVDFTDGDEDVVVFFLIQAIAAALLAWVTWMVLPPNWREPRKAVFALLFSFAFFIPLLGAGGMLIAVALTLLMPRRWRYKDFGEVERVEYTSTARDTGIQLRISSLRTTLLDPSAAPEMRLKSLVAMQQMPMRIVGPLLRKLLGDPSDDLRLVAYGMLDGEEKRINALITAELQNLDKAGERSTRANSLRHLAELHWELVYTGLVQGDVRDHTVATALIYLGQALRYAAEDSGLWMLRARLLQAGGDLAGAGEAFNLAVSCGLEESRALPYLAELAYLQRQFALVREYLDLIAKGQVTSVMAPVVEFWLGTRTSGAAA